MKRLLFPLLFLALASPSALAQASAATSITVSGTEIVVALKDGRTARSKDLAGAVLKVRFEGQPAEVRITDVELDPGDPSKSIWLHTFDVRQADGSWSYLCTPGPDGRRQGFPLMGADGGIELSCSSGALAKCVRFGYRPWAVGPDGRSLAPQHAACVRMVRGDYGGADMPFTKDGMNIDVYDLQNIQQPENAPEQTFEAGWAPDGAVCVHHVRVKENVTLADLEARFPHLKGRTGAICTEEFARANGAVVYNRSSD